MVGRPLLTLIALFSGASLTEEASGQAVFVGETSIPDQNADSECYPSPTRYTYQSVVNLNTRYTIVPSTTYTSMVHIEKAFDITDIPADMKLPDEEDPSVLAYMKEGPIRFYLPTTDILSLKSPEWRFRECDFHVVSMINEANGELTLPTQRTTPRLWRTLIEAECDDAPNKAAQYLVGTFGQLLAFTFGDISTSDNGDDVFQPTETFFLTTDLRGFGWVDSARK